MSTELATELGALLDEFTAAQRRDAISQANKQRLTFVRPLGAGQIVCEMVVDEAEDAVSIYEKLARVEAAADRLKAKVDLSDHYSRVLGNINQIEMTRKKLAEDDVKFRAENASRNKNSPRREPVILNAQQDAALRGHRDAIKEHFERIDETQKAIDECKRVLDGEDPFAVVAEQIADRLDKVRGSRGAAAA